MPADRRLRRVPGGFHPVVGTWFSRRFPTGPTAPQAGAWPHIAGGKDVLVASPTGTGKTLTGFLVGIDAGYRAQLGGSTRRPGPGVLYVSPLRALAADVHENLRVPLEEISGVAEELGFPEPDLTVGIRTGDTTPSERAAMRKHPPDLLVTTPESLYLLLTGAASRTMLERVRTVIIDEVHTLARDKRGSHLALSLERLDRLVTGGGGTLQRIGLSATQRPLDVVAGLLVGAGRGRPGPEVVDCGHRRRLDLAIELPSGELEAVASAAQFSDVLDQIAEKVRQHRTTLIFVNTRKLSERVAHLLAERLAPDPGGEAGDLVVAAHHGSLSTARRRTVEARLRAGGLRALVATASLELGIDVGPVELVCQIGSPRSIGTFLQRVGRANHSLDGVPSGRLYPLTHDELVECTALLAAVRSGHLDLLSPPVAPLDILAQQIVAEVAGAGEWEEAALFDLFRGAAPYAGLDRATFDEVVDLVSSGVVTGRGRRGAHLHRDGVNGRLRPRRGARLAALTSGGAIPDTGDYRVVLDPEGVTVGSVHEDFAVEANVGDVFLLGTHSWRVAKVEVGTVRVHDAGDAAPTVPFWLGEAPARTAELSAEVAMLREVVEEGLVAGEPDRSRRSVESLAGVSREVAAQVVDYLGAGWSALGALPTQRRLIIERFFDPSEGAQLVIHSPFGGRVNRALGLALRKRFCVSFDFELQAAADDDTVLLSIGPHHSFPLDRVPKMLSAPTSTAVLTQAVLTHPMLTARWRWNCNRALVLPRSTNGRQRPINLQRMEADDLLAAAWPSLAACQENTGPGPIPVPDHVLVRQTLADCLSEPLDAPGLVDLLERMADGRVAVHFVESAEPSVLAHGILTGRPYTFLDGAPLEERRSRAVPLRSRSGNRTPLPTHPGELGPLDPVAVSAVLDQLRPRPRDPDELHDLLLSLVRCRPVAGWQPMFESLLADRRAVLTRGDWAPAERQAEAEAVAASTATASTATVDTATVDTATIDTDDPGVPGCRVAEPDAAAAECLRGHLELAGPISVADLVGASALPPGAPLGAPMTEARAQSALARLEAEGSAIQLPDGRWCARHLLVRLYGASRAGQRRRVEPSSIADFVRLLLRWQHVAPGTRLEGRSGVLSAVGQLAGLEVPAGDWESSLLPARVEGYDPRWLDELCLSGELAWGRLTPKALPTQSGGAHAEEIEEPAAENGVDAGVRMRGASTPSPATPLALFCRSDLGWMVSAVRLGQPVAAPATGAAADLLAALRRGGACFRSDLGMAGGRLPVEVDQGLWDLVARGLVTADAFSAVRSLLSSGHRRSMRRYSPGWVGAGRRRSPVGSGTGEGRWALLTPAGSNGLSRGGIGDFDDLGPDGMEEMAEKVAWQMLGRWGIVCWELWGREPFRIPWRRVQRALRRFEARGTVLGGRFVAGLSGEQYAVAEAVELLGALRGRCDDWSVTVAASDPLNVTGSVIPGPRVPSVRRRQVTYRNGIVVDQSR